MTSLPDNVLCLMRGWHMPDPHDTTHCSTVTSMSVVQLRDKTQLLWEQTDFDVTAGQCFVSDERMAHARSP